MVGRLTFTLDLAKRDLNSSHVGEEQKKTCVCGAGCSKDLGIGALPSRSTRLSSVKHELDAGVHVDRKDRLMWGPMLAGKIRPILSPRSTHPTTVCRVYSDKVRSRGLTVQE